MTGRAAFGDFLRAAHQQLGTPATFRTAVARGGDVPEIRSSLLHIVLVMSRLVQDTTATGPEPLRGHPPLAGWDRAGLKAREALIHAAACLHGDTLGGRRAGVPAGSELARRLDAAALSLTYGRDLLHTHFAGGPRGRLRFRTEWGSVLATPRARQAMLAEMGSLASRLMPLSEQLEFSARARGSPRAHQAIKGACHWLQVMDTIIRHACHDQPLARADLEVLRAVPAGASPPRPRADPGGPAGQLPQAVIAAAERARHAAWVSESRPPWPPGMSVTSLRHTAAMSTLTSHHCEILLRALARTQPVAGEPGTSFQPAADAAGLARARWLGIARALDQVTTSNQPQPSQPAAAAGDLALWTGRLAYTDPHWTLASSPARAADSRDIPSLEPGAAGDVLAAVHDACDAVNRLACADRRQVRALAGAGQVLAAAGPEPGTLDLRGPLAPARPDRIGALLTLYQYAGRASAETTTAVSEAAAATQAPRRTVLPAIRAGHHRDPAGPETAGQLAEAQSVYQPGRIERTLRGLGVTDTSLLRRAEDIDRAAEQLITQTAAEGQPPPTAPPRVQSARSGDRQGRPADPQGGTLADTREPPQADEAQAEP